MGHQNRAMVPFSTRHVSTNPTYIFPTLHKDAHTPEMKEVKEVKEVKEERSQHSSTHPKKKPGLE